MLNENSVISLSRIFRLCRTMLDIQFIQRFSSMSRSVLQTLLFSGPHELKYTDFQSLSIIEDIAFSSMDSQPPENHKSGSFTKELMKVSNK